MTLFVKLDPGFLLNRKAVQVGPFGRLLFISGLGYCVEGLTDGFIPAAVVRRLTDVDDPDGDASRDALVSAGLWEEVPDGYVVHDYHDWQSSSSSVAQRREQGRRRQQRYRDAGRDASLTGPEVEVEPEVTNSQPAPSSTSVKQKASKTSAPENSELTERRWQYALGVGMTRPTAERNWSDFLDWHRAKGNRWADWDRAWQQWCRRWADRGQQAPAPERPKEPAWRRARA